MDYKKIKYDLDLFCGCAFELAGITLGAAAAYHAIENNSTRAACAFVGGLVGYFTGKSMNRALDAEQIRQSLKTSENLEKKSKTP